MNNAEIEVLGDSGWDDVTQAWKFRERGIWEEHIRDHGYRDWMDFRLGPKGTMAKYGFLPLLSQATWRLGRVRNPAQTVPVWHVGPFKGWAIHNPQRNPDGSGIQKAISFAQVLERGEIQKNTRVRAIIDHIVHSEEPRTASVLSSPDGRVVAFDGSHTLSAYTLAASEGLPIRAPLLVYQGLLPESALPEFQKLFEPR